MNKTNRIAILITCHNRQDKTLACLGALFANHLPVDVSLHVILVDDGSTDGTAYAVRERFPQVEILQGDGTLYWNGGMCLAFGEALKVDYEYYLWINDDTLLYRDSITRLIASAEALLVQTGAPVIVVGTTVDPITGQPTYGGRSRNSRLKPTRFELVIPGTVPVACDTMNGNCVLIPSAVAAVVGNLDAVFEHAMGDNDYGLRAQKAGFGVWVTPGIIGTCAKNPMAGSFLDTKLSLKERFQKILQPKNLPFRAWMVFTKRHAGPFWPLYCLWPYVKITGSSFLCGLRKATAGRKMLYW